MADHEALKSARSKTALKYLKPQDSVAATIYRKQALRTLEINPDGNLHGDTLEGIVLRQIAEMLESGVASSTYDEIHFEHGDTKIVVLLGSRTLPG